MSNELKIINDENYQKWICEIKELVHVSQLKAAVQVNTEMIRMYWHIGKEISDKHADAIWGTGFYKTMSQSLKEEFPSVSGFSVTNLKYMKRFFEFYKSDNENRQQVVDDLEKNMFNTLGTPYSNNDKMRKCNRSIILCTQNIRKWLEQSNAA